MNPILSMEDNDKGIRGGGALAIRDSVVKLFEIHCFCDMDRNVNTQRRICGPHMFNKFIFP